MKLLKMVITIATIAGTIITIYSFAAGTVYILTELGIVGEEDLDYLGVASDYITIDGQEAELVEIGDYRVVSDSLDKILRDVGEQTPDKCLDYSNMYAHKIVSGSYKLLASESKTLILKVAASELYEGRPVIARVTTSNKKTINGIEMCSRHFVTIVRNKKECKYS